LRNLDENGIVRVGTYVKPGDILVGKVSPKSKTELTPEEKLLHAIFGRAGEDVKNDSLEVPSGIEGIVIEAQRFSRRMSLTDDERKKFEKELKDVETSGNQRIADEFGDMISNMESVLKKPITDNEGTPLTRDQDPKFIAEQAQQFRLDLILSRSSDTEMSASLEKIYKAKWPEVEAAVDIRDRRLNSMKRGDELRSGVLQMVKVYIATKRVISVGDKMAGRHGNKGVIAKILPVEDMPFLPDGTPLQIMLNPLGVPSRMNVGQILETHLGWAGANLGFQAITPVFEGASEEVINDAWRKRDCRGMERRGCTTDERASRSSRKRRSVISTC
jgi:DNA-directed RNA polymerase subunit beta